MAFFQDNLVSCYQNVFILDFIGAKGDGGDGDNWSYKSCKAPVKLSPPTNQHIVFFTGWMPFLSPNQQCQSTEGKEALSLMVDNNANYSVIPHTNNKPINDSGTN